MPHHEPLTDQALNRALLARQGLLERKRAPITDVVESIGAIQAQYWPAAPVSLWSRMHDVSPAALYDALTDGRLVTGHLVTAREYPDYAAVAAQSGTDRWHRSKADPTPGMERLRRELADYAASQTRSGAELSEFAETAVAAALADNPDLIDAAELHQQRASSWRAFFRWSGLLRVPADGSWGPKKPAAYSAAPLPQPWSPQVLATTIRRYLQAFGPASAADAATWLGWSTPPIRQVMEHLGEQLARFTDAAGRTLYDLPEAPRPGPDIAAPVRLLPGFDSTLLAYAAKHRARILPEPYRGVIYQAGNLTLLPTFLVDGLVAGTWATTVARREATLTLRPLQPLTARTRTDLIGEAERLLHAVQPDATAHHVVVETG
ncbi:MAG: winged helix DNA-binding domain-containing protein [Mycobacteriales bacterium]